MSLFNFWKGEPDKSLIEVSNDSGDHIVIEMPTDYVREVEEELRKAGCKPDKTEAVGIQANTKRQQRAYEKRDHKAFNFFSRRVVNDFEELECNGDYEQDDSDLEDTFDKENDRSDWEPDNQPEFDAADFEANEQPVIWRWK